MNVLLWYLVDGQMLGSTDKHPVTGNPLTRQSAKAYAKAENAKPSNQKRGVFYSVRLVSPITSGPLKGALLYH